EEFEEQRKLRLREVPSEERRSLALDEFMERASGIRTLSDDALIGTVIDHFPTLGIIVPLPPYMVRTVHQRPPSPQVAAKQGTKNERMVERHEKFPVTKVKQTRTRTIARNAANR